MVTLTQDVIAQGKIQLDSFFIFSILRDISNGLAYIHHSALGAHGNMTSESCLVDDRWQVRKADKYTGAQIRAMRETQTRKLRTKAVSCAAKSHSWNR